MGGRPFDEQSRLEVVPDPDGLRSGSVGAAGREVPYWLLLDAEGKPWGRLCLWFDDEDHAVQEMQRQLVAGYPEVLEHGVVRRLREVEVATDASVVNVRHNDWLVLYLQEVTAGAGGVPAPAPLLQAERFDVARITRQRYPHEFELAVVTERALEQERVRCTPGRALVFQAA